MKKIIVLMSSALMLASLVHAGGVAHSLNVGEGFVDPLGFHDATPTFSWKLPDGVKKQTAYQVRVKGDAKLWDSGWVESDQSVYVPFGGDPLSSRQRVTWQVRYKDESGEASEWSEPAKVEVGLLSKKDWDAKWIRVASKAPKKVEKVSRFRRGFKLEGGAIERARLYVAARGLYEITLNGKRVGDDYFANGFTPYRTRVDSVTYDVTDLLKEGGNSFDALLGYGWYAGQFGWSNPRSIFGPYPELLLQLEVVYDDGRVTSVVSDESWEATFNGPILSSSIYHGEHVDMRKEWTGWAPVTANADLGEARIAPKPFATVKKTERLAVREITEPKPGRFVFDLGQNMVGWAKLNIPVEKDQKITVRFAEMLNADGTVHTKNYRRAKSTDSYTAAEKGVIEWEPKFTFHGFRYVELSGFPNGVKPDKSWVTGIVLHTEMEPIGTFETSHAKLNQLQSNIRWGQRGNFLDIPTDCPQRDERAGWTGDAQAFTPASMFNYDCRAFWRSWLASMRDDQLKDGSIPHVIPDITGSGGSPGWVDAATIVPWEVYRRSGNVEVLAENYEMMEKLVGWYRSRLRDGEMKVKGFGDWLQPHTENKRGDTPQAFLGMAFYTYSCQILADSAAILGHQKDAEKYAAEAKSLKELFTKKYFDKQGALKVEPETQTAYLLAIAFDLIPDSMKKGAAKRLERLVKEADGHLRTGFLGTPFIVSVLDEMGMSDLAASVLFKETYPSWFYSINQGATTVWERWNSYSKKDGFSGDSMNSLNHYAYGAVGQWMVERLAGLAPDLASPGYKHFYVRPVFVKQLDWARAELETAYGLASSAWKRKNNIVFVKVVVPPNTTATIVLPDGRGSKTVGAGTYQYQVKNVK